MKDASREWLPLANPLGFVRLVLLVDWDPIGVFGYPSAMDEYDGYAPGVLALLERGSSDVLIVAHLKHIERERMGLPDNSSERLLIVAAKLQAAYAMAYTHTLREANEEPPD